MSEKYDVLEPYHGVVGENACRYFDHEGDQIILKQAPWKNYNIDTNSYDDEIPVFYVTLAVGLSGPEITVRVPTEVLVEMLDRCGLSLKALENS